MTNGAAAAATTGATRAIVLFGHGSRDALWRAPIEAVAARLALLEPGCPVRCAYLELTTPDLPTVVAELVQLGVRSLRVVPMFLGVGRHAREDLPALVDGLRLRFPALELQLAPAVGEDERVLDVLAHVAHTPPGKAP